MGINAFNEFSLKALMLSLSKYLQNHGDGSIKEKKVILFHNGYEQNRLFVEIALNILTSQGIHVYLNVGNKTCNSGICSYYMQRQLADIAIIFDSDRFDITNTYCEIFASGGLRLPKKELEIIVKNIDWNEKIFLTHLKSNDAYIKFLNTNIEDDFINDLKHFQIFATLARDKTVVINILDHNNYIFIKKIFNELGYSVINFNDISEISDNFKYNYINIDYFVENINALNIDFKDFGPMLFLDNNLKYIKLVFQDLNNKWIVLKDFELYYALIKFQILCNNFLNNPNEELSNVCYTALSPTIHQYKNNDKFENLTYANVSILLEFIKKTKKNICIIFDEDGLLFTENNILNYNSGIINFIKILDMWNYYYHQNTNIFEVSKIDYISDHFYDYLHWDKYIYDTAIIKKIIAYLQSENINVIGDIPIFKKDIILNNQEYFIVKCFLNKKDLFNFCGFKIHKDTAKISSYFSILSKDNETLYKKMVFFKEAVNKFFNGFLKSE